MSNKKTKTMAESTVYNAARLSFHHSWKWQMIRKLTWIQFLPGRASLPNEATALVISSQGLLSTFISKQKVWASSCKKPFNQNIHLKVEFWQIHCNCCPLTLCQRKVLSRLKFFKTEEKKQLLIVIAGQSKCQKAEENKRQSRPPMWLLWAGLEANQE